MALLIAALLSGCTAPPLPIETALPGAVRVEDVLLVALPIVNTGDQHVSGIQISAVDLASAKRLRPHTLPFSVPDLPPGSSHELQLAFESKDLVEGQTRRLGIRGTATASGRSRPLDLNPALSIPPPPAGERAALQATVEASQVDGGGFEPGGESFKIESTQDERTVPIPMGLVSGNLEPVHPPIAVARRSPGGGGPQTEYQQRANEPITFVRAGHLEVREVGAGGGDAMEPSGGSVDIPGPFTPHAVPMVFLSGNTYLLLSLDGGVSYTQINPFTLFPPSSIPPDGLPQDEGICCDQNLIYIPGIDRFVWQVLTRGSWVAWLTDANGELVLDEDGEPIPLNSRNRLRLFAYAASRWTAEQTGFARALVERNGDGLGILRKFVPLERSSFGIHYADLHEAEVPNLLKILNAARLLNVDARLAFAGGDLSRSSWFSTWKSHSVR